MDQYIEEYVNQADWRIKENSNTVFSIGGMKNLLAETAIAKHSLKSLPEGVRNAHEKHLMHIHDLGNFPMVYCVGWSVKDILLNGLKVDTRFPASEPAKHFGTALEHILNHCFIHTNEASGAMAYSSVDVFLAPFIKEDGLNYTQVKQQTQRLIFALSQKYRSGLQSPFSNITLDLKPLGSMKTEKVIVGGSELDYTYSDCQPEIDMFNKAFCKVMSAGDGDGKPFSFPIPTYSMTKEFDWEGETAKQLFEMAVKTGIPYFSNFINSDMNPDDVRSMCPLDCNEEVLIIDERTKRFKKIPIGQVYHSTHSGNSTVTRKTLSAGKLVTVKVNKVPATEYLDIELVNGIHIRTTKDHMNMTLRGPDIRSRDLTEDDYLPFSKKTYEGSGLTHIHGFLLGAFLGDGSYKDKKTIVYSLNYESKNSTFIKIKEAVNTLFGAECSEYSLKSDLSGKYSCVNLSVNSKSFRSFIEEFSVGHYAKDKSISLDVLTKSKEFRQGIIDGLYATDGGNKNRIYTTSKTLKDDLVTLLATLGQQARLDVDTRVKSDGKLSDTEVFCIRFYAKDGKGYKNVYKASSDFNWFKIKSITPYVKPANSNAYCLEVVGDEPYFMLANGVHTHNCRLRLETRELINNGGGLFGAGEKTGSIGVVTLNLPRLAYMAAFPQDGNVKKILGSLPPKTAKDFKRAQSDEDRFFILIEYTMQEAKESLVIKRGIVEENLRKGLFPYTRVTLDNYSDHFNTLGIVGMNEALLNLGYTDGILTTGKDLAERVLDFMLDKLGDYQEQYSEYYDVNGFKKGLLFNLEATPAEGAGYKLAKYDHEYFKGKSITSNNLRNTDPYYTNSTWLPQDDPINENIFDILDHQDSLQSKYTSGTVQHLYTTGKMTWQKGRDIIKKACENYNLPYLSLSPTIYVCPVHGRIEGEHEYCPLPHTQEEIDYIIKMGGTVIDVPEGETVEES